MTPRPQANKPGKPRPWSWQRLVEVLSNPDATEERRRVTLVLRRLQKVAFEQLKIELENPHSETSWENPRLMVRVDVPWGATRSVSVPSDLSENSEAQRAFLEEVEREEEIDEPKAALHVLTAGAATILENGAYHPLLPLPLLALVDTMSAEQRHAFFERWTNPVSYGDDFEEYGTIVGRSDDGQTFQAALIFYMFPLVLEPEHQESYYMIQAGLPWGGNSSPQTWNLAEREALWKAVSGLLNALVKNAEDGSPCPEKLSERVPIQAPPRKPFRYFDAVFKANEGPSFAEKASVRSYSGTALAGFSTLEIHTPEGSGPILGITDGQGHLHANAFLEVTAVMCHPDSRTLRLEYRTVIEMASNILAGEDAAGANAEQAFKTVLRMPFLVALQKRARTSNIGGYLAGEVLLFVLSAAEHDPQNASVKRAIHILRSRFEADRVESGVPFRTGRSTLLADWGRFKEVAHLWAALNLWTRDMNQDLASAFEPEQDDPTGGLPAFLAIAEELRRRGEMFFSRGQSENGTPLLDPNKTWRTPPDLVLPTVKCGVPPPTEWEKDCLKTYRARPARSRH